ncbi:hypothetical protein [Emcibacter sp. SYSU 3D8]|uniref:hypothetical protein n=1 Tax=Emcibacter sp. SYSU 3D8 TaxID=3133969 RepID=UPI0031FEC772
MPRVMIKCPNTGKQIYTGVNLNWETFESYRFGTQSVPCPECHASHQWSRVDAILDETGGGS